jgi:uncharacterized protein (DUF1810 family)
MSYSRKDLLQQNNSYIKYAKNELTQGKKKSCWAWYIFPQLAGIIEHITSGCSQSSHSNKKYSIPSLDEAKELLNNKRFKENLRKVTNLVIKALDNNNSLKNIMNNDDRKFLSSMRLFYIASFELNNSELSILFKKALKKSNANIKGSATLEILKIEGYNETIILNHFESKTNTNQNINNKLNLLKALVNSNHTNKTCKVIQSFENLGDNYKIILYKYENVNIELVSENNDKNIKADYFFRCD